MKSCTTDINIPHMGISINWDTNRTSGLKNMSFGFTVNKTNAWNEDIYASGTNSKTSFMGAMAAGASGLIADNLASEDAFFNNQPWRDVVGYQSGMISPYATDEYGDLQPVRR